MSEQWSIEELVRGLVDAAVAGNGCELWEMRFVGNPGNRSLKVFIDAPGGVDLERCTRVAQTLQPALEAEGLDDVALEVSSPGAERRLRDLDDYRRHLGSRVNLRLRQDEAETVVEGVLESVGEASVTVVGDRGQASEVPLDRLVEGRLAVAFGGGDKIKRRQT